VATVRQRSLRDDDLFVRVVFAPPRVDSASQRYAVSWQLRLVFRQDRVKMRSEKAVTGDRACSVERLHAIADDAAIAAKAGAKVKIAIDVASRAANKRRNHLRTDEFKRGHMVDGLAGRSPSCLAAAFEGTIMLVRELRLAELEIHAHIEEYRCVQSIPGAANYAMGILSP
jgi:hypothetical protein